MKSRSTVTAAELQSHTPKVLREAGRRGMLAVTEAGQVTAFLISRDRVMAMIETMEILSNPAAMKAIRDFETGKGKFYTVGELDEEMLA
jgi:PHD/YefM family antitoxin component YafN of YafNO toxin-antitoxin module